MKHRGKNRLRWTAAIAAGVAITGLGYGSILLSSPEGSMRTFMGWLATGLGLGHVPLLPGSAGALVGIVPALWIARLRPSMQLAAIVGLVVIALVICALGQTGNIAADDPRIIADELLTFPIATAGLPVHRHPALLAGVFVTSRVLDGLKPFPAGLAAGLPGGSGVVLDDVIANGWTWLFFWLGWTWWRAGISRS